MASYDIKMFYQNGFRNPNMPTPTPQKNPIKTKNQMLFFENDIQGGKNLNTVVINYRKLLTSYYLIEYLLPLTSFILAVYGMICTVNSSYGEVT